MTDPEILWVPWSDPLREVKETVAEDEHDPDAFRARASFGVPQKRKRRSYKGAAVVVGDAIVPIDEDNLPSSLYNLWMGHTDFVIDRPFENMVVDMVGVEDVKVFTKHRMRVAFGRLFDDKVVKEAILDAARKHLNG